MCRRASKNRRTSGLTGSSIPTIHRHVRLETIRSSSSHSGSLTMCSSFAAAPSTYSIHQRKLSAAADRKRCLPVSPNAVSKVKHTSICIAHFYANRLKCAQTWITQFYLQITPCLPLFPSRRTSPPFGWYSFYRPTEGIRLSRPGWLVTY